MGNHHQHGWQDDTRPGGRADAAVHERTQLHVAHKDFGFCGRRAEQRDDGPSRVADGDDVFGVPAIASCDGFGVPVATDDVHEVTRRIPRHVEHDVALLGHRCGQPVHLVGVATDPVKHDHDRPGALRVGRRDEELPGGLVRHHRGREIERRPCSRRGAA
jgi:hypothetical protein